MSHNTFKCLVFCDYKCNSLRYAGRNSSQIEYRGSKSTRAPGQQDLVNCTLQPYMQYMEYHTYMMYDIG